MSNLKAYAIMIDPESPTDAKLVSELAHRGYIIYQPVRTEGPAPMERAFATSAKRATTPKPKKKKPTAGKRRVKRTNVVNGRGVLQQLIALVGQRHLVENEELEIAWMKQVDKATGRRFSIQSLRFILEKLIAAGLAKRTGNGGGMFTQPAVNRVTDLELRDMLARVGSHWH